MGPETRRRPLRLDSEENRLATDRVASLLRHRHSNMASRCGYSAAHWDLTAGQAIRAPACQVHPAGQNSEFR